MKKSSGLFALLLACVLMIGTVLQAGPVFVRADDDPEITGSVPQEAGEEAGEAAGRETDGEAAAEGPAGNVAEELAEEAGPAETAAPQDTEGPAEDPPEKAADDRTEEEPSDTPDEERAEDEELLEELAGGHPAASDIVVDCTGDTFSGHAMVSGVSYYPSGGNGEAMYNASTGTLYLTDYDGGWIYVDNGPDNAGRNYGKTLTIEIDGSSTIHSIGQFGIYA